MEELLEPSHLSPDLESIRSERPPRSSPPNYVGVAPKRSDFWEMSSDNDRLSTQGCFPLTASPSPLHYKAIVETQVNLKTLQMLQTVKGDESHRLLEQFRNFQNGGKASALVGSLIDGLVLQQICVYRGLDTGFGVPGGDDHFWGVSSQRDASTRGCVDIFISQKAPNDASAVLHTWLAHHNVSRVERFEQDMGLESANGLDEMEELPSSVSAAIEGATNSELLFLLEQVRVSELIHPFREAIISRCRRLLIDAPSRSAWRRLHSLGLIEGSVDMSSLLNTRLEHFAKRGASSLPSLGNLVRLYEMVDGAVSEALFYGDREKLNAMMEPLLRAYDPWMSWSGCDFVDINADLFGLIFFGVLRRSAYEDVYIEATDRCPFFLSQPDQAAVFSELWVLGSQCEIYFGLLPRDMGEIVYNRYQKYLEVNPPIDDPNRGTELMSMYSSSAASSDDSAPKGQESAPPMTTWAALLLCKKRFLEFGALSIFCLPAILDVVLLTFVGRGLFMTAFMAPEYIEASGYALLVSLLLSAGVTGWVGSVGNYYLPHVSPRPFPPAYGSC